MKLRGAGDSYAGFHCPRRVLLAWLLMAPWLPAAAQDAHSQAIDIPRWFSEGFLDFREEAAAADRAGKRLLVYFGQEGCPYCRELMQNNFSQHAIVDKTRRHFVAIALDLWGDREVTWIDGRTMSEKAFARMQKVQFTPTLLFLDGQGRIVARLNGYLPPARFSAALDYVAAHLENRQTLGDYLAAHVKDEASARLNDEAFLMAPPFDLRRRAGGKPLAVLFETRDCQACDEMHREGFKRAEVKAQLERFDIARFALSDPRQITTPDGRKTTAQAWAHELQVGYTPTIVFFDGSGGEVFRIDGYLRPFHLAGSFEYVASGSYRTEPEFQRYLRAKADRMRAAGQVVELWR
jgi:thioredoxin-related protein